MTSQSTDNEHWFLFEGHRVFYRREGEGDPIVFLPNATLTGKLWEHQLKYFRDAHDVIAVDLPGFGRSDRLPDGPSLRLWLRWFDAFVEELDLAPVAIVGNCMGSLTALHYATEHRARVRALVLMNMVDHEVGMAGPMGRGAGILKVEWMRPAIEWAVRHTPRRLALGHPYPNSQFGDLPEQDARPYHEHALRCFADPETRIALVRLGYVDDESVLPSAELLVDFPPTCWIWGKANKLLPYEVGMRQLDVLHPDEVHMLEGVGYAAAWEAPAEVNRIIERFLDRHRLIELSDGRRLDIGDLSWP